MHGPPASQESLLTSVTRDARHMFAYASRVRRKSTQQGNWKEPRNPMTKIVDAKALSMVRDSIALRRLTSSCSSGHLFPVR
jgi:hypothetical protein